MNELRSPVAHEQESAAAVADDGPKFVVGLDYGTTYTGLAWASILANQGPEEAEFELFKDWPLSRESKVPSEISYAKSQHHGQWGFDIAPGNEPLTFRWTKLALAQQKPVDELKVLKGLMEGFSLIRKLYDHQGEVESRETPQHITKSSQNVIQDYLKRVIREWRSHIGGAQLDEVPLDIVITHPVDWPEEALNKTYRAVRGAFPKLMFPTLRHTFLVPEPEACAIYTVHKLLGQDQLNRFFPGDCFVLCDAGGGTVDLASYLIKKRKPLKLEQVGLLSGKRCGATCIDRAFLKWCERKLSTTAIFEPEENSGGHFLLQRLGRKLLHDFEENKRAFSGSEEAQIEIPSWAEGDVDLENNDTGILTVTAEDMQDFLKESVDGILDLIDRQITQVENLDHVEGSFHVSTIFMSGGLSENPYLYRRVEAVSRGRNVQRAHDAWSGVAQGAVLTGLGVGTNIPNRVNECPRYYGICVQQAYKSHLHHGVAPVQNSFDGKTMASNPITWLVNQGDLILPSKGIHKQLAIRCNFSRQAHIKQEMSRIVFVAVRARNPPKNLSEVPRDTNTVVDFDVPAGAFDIKKLPLKQGEGGRSNYYSVSVDARVHVSDKLQVEIVHQGNVLRHWSSSL